MNTIADKMRARARMIRDRSPGYEGYRQDDSDASFLEELADDLEKDEDVLSTKFEEDLDELKDQIRDKDREIDSLKEEIEELKYSKANLEHAANTPRRRKP